MENKCIITIIVIIIVGHFIFATQEISVVPCRPMFRQRPPHFPRHRVRTGTSHHAYVRWVRFLPSYGRHQSVGGKQESCSERGGGATEMQSHMLSKLCRRTHTGKAQRHGKVKAKLPTTRSLLDKLRLAGTTALSLQVPLLCFALWPLGRNIFHCANAG